MRTASPDSETASRLTSELSHSKNKLSSDFKGLMNEAEELLRTTANYSGEGFAQARAKFEERLSEMKDSLSDAQSYALDKYKEVADNTDRYVRDKPWQAIGIAAAVGILVGFLVSRR